MGPVDTVSGIWRDLYWIDHFYPALVDVSFRCQFSKQQFSDLIESPYLISLGDKVHIGPSFVGTKGQIFPDTVPGFKVQATGLAIGINSVYDSPPSNMGVEMQQWSASVFRSLLP